MEIKSKIQSNISKTKNGNAKRTESYKQNLLSQLKSNIDKAADKVKAVADNKGIIDRYKSAQPQPLTQMQQAFEGAL